ncbi:hypothetical protein [Nostoc sp. NZL]|uniref:hypothetical protein n=1 Tax=Nostoc sp. NZL TaxID=2650612 RepID=UPI0018C65C01|nr:hypothetical protein [Nostoc sp. NZL]
MLVGKGLGVRSVFHAIGNRYITVEYVLEDKLKSKIKSKIILDRLARICQELQAIELDFWHEYTLLKIDADVDEEPTYVLKMPCHSTGFIHALRVPPNINSAREAIRWVNWGIEPEEFAMQT